MKKTTKNPLPSDEVIDRIIEAIAKLEFIQNLTCEANKLELTPEGVHGLWLMLNEVSQSFEQIQEIIDEQLSEED